MRLSGYKTRRNLTIFVIVVRCWRPIVRGPLSFAFRTNHNVVENSFRICYQVPHESVENVLRSIVQCHLPEHHGCEVGPRKALPLLRSPYNFSAIIFQNLTAVVTSSVLSPENHHRTNVGIKERGRKSLIQPC